MKPSETGLTLDVIEATCPPSLTFYCILIRVSPSNKKTQHLSSLSHDPNAKHFRCIILFHPHISSEVRAIVISFSQTKNLDFGDLGSSTAQLRFKLLAFLTLGSRFGGSTASLDASTNAGTCHSFIHKYLLNDGYRLV